MNNDKPSTGVHGEADQELLAMLSAAVPEDLEQVSDDALEEFLDADAPSGHSIDRNKARCLVRKATGSTFGTAFAPFSADRSKWANRRGWALVIGTLAAAAGFGIAFLISLPIGQPSGDDKQLTIQVPPLPEPVRNINPVGDAQMPKPDPRGHLPETHLSARARQSVPEIDRFLPGEMIVTTARQRRRTSLPDGSILFINGDTTVIFDAPRRLTVQAGEVFIEVAPDKNTKFVINTPEREVVALGTKFSVHAAPNGTGVFVTQGSVRMSGVEDPIVAGERILEGEELPERAPRAPEPLWWVSDLMQAAEAPLVPRSQYGGGAITIIDQNGQESRLSMEKYLIDVHIEDGFARTTIDQTYFNHTYSRQEGTFYFPLPPDASLSRLAMYVNNKLMEGGMVERNRARDVYETIRYQRRDPALLEWVDGSTFKMRVLPLEPRQEKRIILSYTQRLNNAYGNTRYRFPGGHNMSNVGEWAANIRVKNGQSLLGESPSHRFDLATDGDDQVFSASAKDLKPDLDILLNLHRGDGKLFSTTQQEPRFSVAEYRDHQYLMLRWYPDVPLSGKERRKNWIVLFEASGNRDSLLARLQIDVLNSILTNSSYHDTFTVLAANTTVEEIGRRTLPATPENVREVVAALGDVHLVGALDLAAGFKKTSKRAAHFKNPVLLHVGAGVPSIGERENRALLELLDENIKYVGIGVGKNWNQALMKSAASKTGGYFTQVTPDQSANWRGFEIASALNAPRLLDMEVVDSNGELEFLLPNDTFSHGDELCAVARLKKGTPLPRSIELSGSIDGKPWKKSLPVGAPATGADYLPRFWTRLEIDRLVAGGAEANRGTIVPLSKEMYVMSPFTSLLVLENERMYTEFKVDRGRRDHWAMYPAPVLLEPSSTKPSIETQPTEKPDELESPKRYMVFRDPIWKRFAVSQTNYSFNGVAIAGDAPITIADMWGSGHLGVAVAPIRRDFAFPASDSDGDLTFGYDSTFLYRGRNQARDTFSTRIAMDDTHPDQFSFANAGSTRDDRFGFGAGDGLGDGLDGWGSGGGAGMPLRTSRLSAERPGIVPLFDRFLDDGAEKPRWNISGASAASKERVSRPPRRRTILPPSGSGQSMKPSSIVTGGTITLTSGGHVQDLLDIGFTSPVSSVITNRPGFYRDLLAFAPAVNTWPEDRRLADDLNRPDSVRKGSIDPAARELIEKARAWLRGKTIAVRDANDNDVAEFTFGSADISSFRIDRKGYYDLTESAYSDGTTLDHHYPDLGIGATRKRSRFHWARLFESLPVWLPEPDEITVGNQVLSGGDNFVIVRPLQRDNSYVEHHLRFDDQGALVSRSIIEMPSEKLIARMQRGNDGIVRWFDAHETEVARLMMEIAPARVAVDAGADADDLVLLPMPYRRSESYENIEQLTPLKRIVASIADGQPGPVELAILTMIENGDRRLGLYTLMLSMGGVTDPLESYPNNALAHYIGTQISAGDSLARDPGASIPGDDNAFIRRLAAARHLQYRWNQASNGTLSAKAASLQFESIYRDRIDADAEWLPAITSPFWVSFNNGSRTDARSRLLTEACSKMMDRGKVDAAIGIAYQCLQFNDGRPTSRSLLEQIGERMPAKNDPESLVQLAYLSHGVGADELAIQFIDPMVAIDRKKESAVERIQLFDSPDDHLKVIAFQLAARIAKSANRPVDAALYAERALDIDYQLLDESLKIENLRRAFGELLEMFGQIGSAATTLQQDAPAGLRERIVRTADRWRALDPDTTHSCNAAAAALFGMNESELAWAYVTTPIAQRPNESQPWLNVARQMTAVSRLDQADEAYAEAFTTEPTNPSILWDRAQLAESRAMTKHAKSLYQQITEGDWQPRFANFKQNARNRILHLGGN